MGGGDGPGVLRGGFLQGSLGQVIQESGQAVASLEEQLQSRRLEGVGVDADFLKARLDIAGQLLARPGLQAQAKAQAGLQRGVDAHLQSGQELFVADQEQAKGRLGVAAVATQQAHLLQRGGAQVLGLVQNDHGPKPV